MMPQYATERCSREAAWSAELEAASQRRDVSPGMMKLLDVLCTASEGREHFSIPWQGIVQSLYPMPEATARHAR